MDNIRKQFEAWQEDNIKYIVRADFWPWLERAYRDGYQAALGEAYQAGRKGALEQAAQPEPVLAIDHAVMYELPKQAAQHPSGKLARRWCAGDHAWSNWQPCSLADYEQWKSDNTFEFKDAVPAAPENELADLRRKIAELEDELAAERYGKQKLAEMLDCADRPRWRMILLAVSNLKVVAAMRLAAAPKPAAPTVTCQIYGHALTTCGECNHESMPERPHLSDEQIKACIDNINFSQMVTANDLFYLIARAVLKEAAA